MNPSAPVEHIPYDIMVGIWVGTPVSFSPTGQSRNLIYWHKRPTRDDPEGVLHFRQDQGQEGQVGVPAGLQGMIFSEYDLTVTGKHAESVSPSLTLIGVETRPDVYHFDGTEN